MSTFTVNNIIYELNSSTTVFIPSFGFSGITTPTNVVIPANVVDPNTSNSYSVIEIGTTAAYQNSNLISITLPNTLTTISVSAFDGCNNLTTVIMTNSVTSILYGAFNQCISLVEITLSNQITTISSNTFYSCFALQRITITDNVTSIGELAFYNCTSLNTVVLGANIDPAQINRSAFDNTPTSIIAYVPNSVSDSVIADLASLRRSDLSTPMFSQVLRLNVPCFKKGTKILTKNGYVAIENLKKGDLVKTLKNNFLPIEIIGKSVIFNAGNKKRIKQRLYKLSKSNYPDLLEDLVLTGSHSLLVNKLTEKQEEETLKDYGHLLVTDGKLRLETYLDLNADTYTEEGNFTIYHIALENENYYYNYAIWANGLLVETCSKRYLIELSNMTLI